MIEKKTLSRTGNSSANWKKDGINSSDALHRKTETGRKEKVDGNKKTINKVLNYFNEQFSDEEEEKEDVNISARIREFQPTKEDITQKETMLIEKNTANANDESFVTFKPEPAEQKKEKSDDEENSKITLDSNGYDLSESDFSFHIDENADKKCDAEVEVRENYKSDYKKKFKDRLTLNRKIKVDKLHLYPQVGTIWNSYDKVLSKFCENSPKEIEVLIPKGGSFQISGFKVMNNKKKITWPMSQRHVLMEKKITFICKSLCYEK